MSLGLASGSSQIGSKQPFRGEVEGTVSLVPIRTYSWRRKGSIDKGLPG